MKYIGVILLIIFGVQSVSGSSVCIDMVVFDPKTPSIGKEFDIHVMVRNYGGDAEVDDVTLTINGEVVKNHGSFPINSYETKAVDFTNIVLEDCGLHAVMVDLSVKDNICERVTSRLEGVNLIGGDYIVSHDLRPAAGEDLKIVVTDDLNGTFKDAVIKIRKKGSEDALKTSSIKEGEEVTFRPEDQGTYIVEVKGPEHCSVNHSIDVKLSRYALYAFDARVGDPIIITVMREKAITGSGGRPTGQPSVWVHWQRGVEKMGSKLVVEGYGNITINEPGVYILSVDDDSLVWGTWKQIRVYDKPVLDVNIPDNATIGNTMTLSVKGMGKEKGEPIKGVSVTIYDPGGNEKNLKTGSEGTVSYIPYDVGKYFVRISDSDYATMEKEFEVLVPMNINIKPTKPTIEDEITIQARDYKDYPVKDAVINIRNGETSIVEKTDINGVIRLEKGRLSRVGKYSIAAKKENYLEVKEDMSLNGMLYINFSKDKTEPLSSILISISGNPGIENGVDIIITPPTGDKIIARGAEYNYTPDRTGMYAVSVTADDYINASKSFSVDPSPLNMSGDLKDKKLILKVINPNTQKEVAGVDIRITYDGRVEKTATNEKGTATIDVKKPGSYVIHASKVNYNPVEEEFTVAKVQEWGSLILPLILVVIAVLLLLGRDIILDAVGVGKKKNKEEKRPCGLGAVE